MISQNSPAGSLGSPASGAGSARKRQHSNGERGKRVARSLNSLMDRPAPNNQSE